jgi:diguanylate cyclase (GGDEF)-like protein
MATSLSSPYRPSVIHWLVSGALAVVVVLFVGNRMVQERATVAAASIVRIHAEADPIVSASLELDAAVDRIESAVTTTLRSAMPAGEVEAPPSTSETASAQLALLAARQGLQGLAVSPQLNQLLDAYSLDADQLVNLDAQRRRATRDYGRAIGSLAARVSGAGGDGIWVGEQNVARRSLTELATAVNAIRAAALDNGLAAFDQPSPTLTRAEQQFERLLQRDRADLRRSPGVAWLELSREDLARARRARQAAQSTRAEISETSSRFLVRRADIEQRTRVELVEPARRKMADAAVRAEQIARDANEAVANVSLRVLAIVLLVFAGTGFAIAAPIRRLREGTRHVAAGALSARVATGGPRELDELAQSFNAMAGELGKAQAQLLSDQALLEDRVAERTAQLRHLAMHDPLTGLPNRRHLFAELDAAIDVATGLGTHVALLVIDLDDFKTSNDSLGHIFGDRLLQAVSSHLQHEFGSEALIARLGGDEFTISKNQVYSAGEVDALAARVVACFRRPLQIDDRELLISASVGSAMAPDHGSDTESLLRSADAALFRAKALGRNRHHAYSPSLLAANDMKFRTEQALRRAIGDDALLLHFQPEISLSTRRVTVAEALLRWRRADGTIATAGEFIGLAAQSDLISQLNVWALDAALAALARQRAGLWPEMRVAVNVSSRQFMAPDFISRIEAALRRHALPPGCLELELTEDVLQTGSGTIAALQSLRAMGITIALDDFGAGFSSLASIERLPLNRVKFDRRLIAAIDENERSTAIVTSMIRLCHELGLAVTAEGVERPAQLALLASLGGVDVQGFLIAQPQPLEELVVQLPALLERTRQLTGAAGGRIAGLSRRQRRENP